MVNALVGHPLFWLGLICRIGLGLSLHPAAVHQWYGPFLASTLTTLSVDPWASWLSGGGDPAAFPYGYAMWLFCLPAVFLSQLFRISVSYGYLLAIFVADCLLLLQLERLFPKQTRIILSAYWLSPIVVLASYGLGLNDGVPIAFLVLSLGHLKKMKLNSAGIWLGVALSAKLSMIIALPFFVIYLCRRGPYRRLLGPFIRGFAITSLVLQTPFLWSRAARLMLFQNPEMNKVYIPSLQLGQGHTILLIPLLYSLILYGVWRLHRLNYDLFYVVLGLPFLMIVLIAPSSPGWFIWALPILVYYQTIEDRFSSALSGAFSGLYVLSTLVSWPLRLAPNLGSFFNLTSSWIGQLEPQWIALLHTLMLAVGVVLAIQILKYAIGRSDYFRFSRQPLVIGIAGDSGSGKDTLAAAISGMFGSHAVARLQGDDYHLWDRQKPMWQVMTHLNPAANDLEGFGQDLMQLIAGREIRTRHYDHQTGKLTKPRRVRPQRIIVACGLHALYLPLLRECYQLKIFLDLDEKLRRYFKLQRDARERGHPPSATLRSLERRRPDSERFIRPQIHHADLIFSLQSAHPAMLKDSEDQHPRGLKLRVKTRTGWDGLSLRRVLVGVCGLHVDADVSGDGSLITFSVEGDSTAEDMASAAQLLCPRMAEFLDTPPQWMDGMLGLMQLISLSHIHQALRKRLI